MILSRLNRLLFAFICVFTAPQIAGGAEFPQELIDCRALTSAVSRLDCYDQLVDASAASSAQEAQTETAQANQPVTVAPAASPPVAALPAPEMSPDELFGKDAVEVRETVQKATGTSEIDQITSLVSSVRSSAAGKAVITLDNGQVWTQIDNTKLRLSNFDQVTIRRASMGSFMLRKVDSKTSIRVKRIS